jgi:hypothetical protein
MVNECYVSEGWWDDTDTGPPKRQLAHGKFFMASILILFESCLQTCMTYTISECTVTPRRYSYFGVVAGLVWSNDPDSYAGSSVCYC